MKTQSFTLRIPIDLLEAIRSKMGEGTRSEFIIQTLREALGVEPQQISANLKVAEQVDKLLYEFEIFKTQIDQIANRIGDLEKTSKSIVVEPKAECRTDSKTDRKTVEEIRLPLEIPDEIPEGAKIVGGKEILKLLRKAQPSSGWNVGKLKSRRKGSAATRWHDIEGYRFIYKGEAGGEGFQKKHEWWVVSPVEPTSSS
jgi:hypothetical protein